MTLDCTAVRLTTQAAPSLSRNFSWALVANILYAACQWAMLVVLAKSCSTETVGVFALALAVSAPVVMFAGLQLRTVQATDARHAYRFHEYLQVRLATTALTFVVVILTCVLGQYSPRVAAIVLTVTVWKCLDGISDVLYGYLQQHEYIRIISISTMSRGALALLLFSTALVVEKNLLLGLLGVASASFLVLICYDLPSCSRLLSEIGTSAGMLDWKQRQPQPTGNFRLLKLAWVALPLGCVQLLVSLSANLPRYSLQHSFGLRELGIYAAVSYFLTVGLVVVNALGQVASPRLAHYFAVGDLKLFRKLMAALLGIGLLLGLAGIVTSVLFGRIVLRLCYQPEYAAYSRTLLLAMIAAAVAYLAWLLGVGITATQTFRLQVAQLGVCTAATYFACLLLVPRWGADGAALAFGAGMLVQAASAALILYPRIGNYRLAGRTEMETTPTAGLELMSPEQL